MCVAIDGICPLRLYQVGLSFIYEGSDLYRSLAFLLSDMDAIPFRLIYLPSVVKCFTVSVGFFNSVLKKSGYILMFSSGETHTRCSLLLSSVKLSLTGAKVSGTFI